MMRRQLRNNEPSIQSMLFLSVNTPCIVHAVVATVSTSKGED